VILGVNIGLALGGAFFTETVYGLPGLGKLAVSAIDNVDLATTQGVVVFATLCVLVFNLVVDTLYAWVDPRIRLS
jgi:peptide/nickel transport system permease protein